MQTEEYDQQPPNTKTKEFHYTEAAANLNRADSALQASGAGPEEEPVSVAMGKSQLCSIGSSYSRSLANVRSSKPLPCERSAERGASTGREAAGKTAE